MPGDESQRAWLALSIGVTAVAWAAIFVRLADEAPPLTIAAYRMLFAAAIVGSVAIAAILWRGDRWPAWSTWLWLALSGAFLAGHFWSWFASLDKTSVGSSVVIVGMQPLMAAALGLIFLRERPTGYEFAGIGLAAIGLVIIGAGDLASSPTALWGDLLALLGGFLAAAYRTVGRHVRDRASTLVYSGGVYCIAAALLWAMVAVVRPQVTGFEASTWGYLLLLAIVPQVVGHTAFNWALRHLRVVTVSIANLGEPVAATLLAIPILGEDPSRGVLIGGPLIIAGVFVGLGGWRSTRAVPEPAA